MVQLKDSLPEIQKTNPFLFQWDQTRRKNYQNYEQKITELEYDLQRTQNSFFYSLGFPWFSQHKYLDLEIYKNLQKIGSFNQDEVKEYEE